MFSTCHARFACLLILLTAFGRPAFAGPHAESYLSFSSDKREYSVGETALLSWASTNTMFCQASGDWSGKFESAGFYRTPPLDGSKTYMLKCNAPGGGVGRTLRVPVSAASTSPAEPTLSLTASDVSVVSGGSTTLSWRTTDADSCQASGAWSGTRSTSGTQSVGPLSGDASFTLSCTGPGGSIAASVAVDVASAPPAVTLTAASSSIESGASTTLTWSSENAASCSASGGWSGGRSLSGSESVSPTANTTYTLSCSGDGGSDAASVTVAVSAQAPAPTLAISASDSSVLSGGSTSVNWAATGADSCQASGGWSGTRSTSGTESVGPLSADASFTLSCTGPGGSIARSVAVEVTSAAPAVSLTAASSSIDSGASTTLTWSAQHATGCSASGGWSGSRPLTGSESISPTANTTYTLSCSGDGGSDSASVIVEVSESPAPTLAFTASDSSVVSGGSTTLSWTTSDADSCQASGGWSGTRAASGSESVGPISRGTTYTLSCTGSGGSVIEMLSISAIGDVTVTWQGPTQNVDGTALTDLAGYRIHYGQISGTYTDVAEVTDPTASSRALSLASGTYYLVMTAFNAAGEESGYSNEINMTAP